MRWLKALKNRFEELAMASTYAQVGEIDAAREVLTGGSREEDGA